MVKFFLNQPQKSAKLLENESPKVLVLLEMCFFHTKERLVSWQWCQKTLPHLFAAHKPLSGEHSILMSLTGGTSTRS